MKILKRIDNCLFIKKKIFLKFFSTLEIFYKIIFLTIK